MTLEHGECGLGHWTSERFNRDIDGLNPRDVIFDDNDPRIKRYTDIWGGEGWIIGYTVGYTITQNGKERMIGYNIIVIDDKNCMSYLDRKAIKHEK